MGRDNSNKKVTLADAKKWYSSFLGTLKFEGIDLNNPYSLGLVNIQNDVMDVPEEETLEDDQKFIDNMNNAFSYAFIKTDRKGNYVNKKNDEENFPEWIEKNTLDPLKLSDKDILKLYEAAKNDRLTIKTNSVQADDHITFKHVYVNTNGESSVTETMTESYDENVKIFERAGYSSSDAEIVATRGTKFRDQVFSKQNMIFDTFEKWGRDGSKEVGRLKKNAERTGEKLPEDIDDLYTTETHVSNMVRYNRYGYETGIIVMGANNPGFFNTKEKKENIDKIYRGAVIPTYLRSEEVQEFLKENPLYNPRQKTQKSSVSYYISVVDRDIICTYFI